MSLLRQNSLLEARKASVLIRLSARVLRFFARVPAALLATFQEENTRATKEAENDGEDRSEHLPDPPHLDYGEVKYGQGMHDYF